MFTIEEIIDIAVHLEKNGEAYYREAAENHPDPSIAECLNWLADEEAAHAVTFQSMKAFLKIEVEDPTLAEMSRRLFEQTIGQQGFSLSRERLASVEATRDLARMAVEFEEDTVIFYELLRSFVQDADVRRQLDRIIEEERNHVRRLTSMVVTETS